MRASECNNETVIASSRSCASAGRTYHTNKKYLYGKEKEGQEGKKATLVGLSKQSLHTEGLFFYEESEFGFLCS